MADLAFFVVGLVVLVAGAEFLVRGAGGAALRMGVSPLVVGLTIVSIGTGAPELITAVVAAWTGHADLAVGNVVGSNIFNILFILGVVSLVAPAVVNPRLVRFDVPVLAAVSCIVLAMAVDGNFGRIDGVLLTIGFVVYIALSLTASRVAPGDVAAEYDSALAKQADRRVYADLVLIGLGLVLLVVGAKWLVDSAARFAEALGVSELVIGLTIVAAGTGLPEAATSVVAMVRGQRDIAVGNAIGSCIVNILLVLGLVGLISPDGAAVARAAVHFDIPVMIGASIACLPIFATGHRIDRWEGTLMLGHYLAYITFLVLTAIQHSALPAFSAAMLWLVLPLSSLTLAVVFYRDRNGTREPLRSRRHV